jgi:hypothetical protein
MLKEWALAMPCLRGCGGREKLLRQGLTPFHMLSTYQLLRLFGSANQPVSSGPVFSVVVFSVE